MFLRNRSHRQSSRNPTYYELWSGKDTEREIKDPDIVLHPVPRATLYHRVNWGRALLIIWFRTSFGDARRGSSFVALCFSHSLQPKAAAFLQSNSLLLSCGPLQSVRTSSLHTSSNSHIATTPMPQQDDNISQLKMRMEQLDPQQRNTAHDPQQQHPRIPLQRSCSACGVTDPSSAVRPLAVSCRLPKTKTTLPQR